MGSPLRSPLASRRIEREIKGMETQPQKRPLSAFLPREHQGEEKKGRGAAASEEQRIKVLLSLELRSCKEGRREEKKHLEARKNPTFPIFLYNTSKRSLSLKQISLLCIGNVCQ